MQQSYLVDGDVSTFDSEGFRDRLATELSIATPSISLIVSAASVRVNATILVATSDEQASIQARMQAFAEDPALATSFLGVSIRSASAPVGQTRIVAVRPPPAPSLLAPADDALTRAQEQLGATTSLITALMVTIIVLLALIVVCVGVCMWRRRSGGDETLERPGSPPSTSTAITAATDGLQFADPTSPNPYQYGWPMQQPPPSSHSMHSGHKHLLAHSPPTPLPLPQPLPPPRNEYVTGGHPHPPHPPHSLSPASPTQVYAHAPDEGPSSHRRDMHVNTGLAPEVARASIAFLVAHGRHEEARALGWDGQPLPLQPLSPSLSPRGMRSPAVNSTAAMWTCAASYTPSTSARGAALYSPHEGDVCVTPRGHAHPPPLVSSVVSRVRTAERVDV